MRNGVSALETIWDEEPVTVCGIPLYPVKMKDYEEWCDCKRVLTMRQTTLPAAYAVMPFLEALHAMDVDMGMGDNLMNLAARALALATRQRLDGFRMRVDDQDHRKLRAIVCQTGEMIFQITPGQFPLFREAIARQNGEELPNEADNPELVEAENDLKAAKSLPLDYNAADKIISVAYQYRIRPKELAEWTVREFEAAVEAINRDKYFERFGNGFYSFKNGENPFPSWCFNKQAGGSAALEPLSAFAQRTGIGGDALPMKQG